MTPEEHRALVEAWRADRLQALLALDGWLTLVGLWWLQPGTNRVGSDPANEVVLPSGPAWVATIEVGERVALHATPGSSLEPAEGMLRDDADGEPTIVELGSLRFHLIRRGKRLGVRVRDHAASTLRSFAGLEHFPIDLEWRVGARLEPGAGRTIRVPDVLGEVNDEPSAGSIHFDLDGRSWRLDALAEDDGSLFLIFGDETNADESYPAGRFLYTAPPADDGSVIVDFNLAYSPPCAFTAYATCPLPPASNHLALRIEAGEKAYGATEGAG